MNKNEIKQHLLENPNLIENVLNYIGCKDIKIIRDKMVQSTRPDGDNKTSVQIKLNSFLSGEIRTKNEFQKFEIKDIFSVIQFIKDCTLYEAINIVCQACNLEFTYTFRTKHNSSAYEFFKKYKRSIKKDYECMERILPDNFITRFVRADCEQYLIDGVSSESQEKFGVGYDVLDNRIVFSIRNDIGQLLSFKGRTCVEDYKIYGIPKFIAYYPCYNNNYLFGLYENYFDILNEKELYIFEAEKSVMIMDSMGINNCVAVNKKNITEMQLKKILKLNKDVVLLFDKDVDLEEILFECSKFMGLCNVFYVHDTLGVLDDKDSPCDKGIDVFNRLINECKIKYEYKEQ